MNKFEIVKKYIDEYDIYDLLPMAPKDKYDFESKSISEQITKNNSIEEIAIKYIY